MTDLNAKAGSSASAAPSDWRQSRRQRLKVAVAAAGGKVVVHLLSASLRLHKQSLASVAARRGSGAGGAGGTGDAGLIFALFHGAHFPTLRAYRDQGAYVIASSSADGEILTRILASFGFKTVRGSSSRGGTRALADLTRHVKAGSHAAIGVDGPRGPRHHVKAGVILLAKLTGGSIIPSAASLSRYWQINSWDRYRIPKPWSRALVVFDEPMTVPPDADNDLIEAKRVELQQRLLSLQQQADEAVMTAATALNMLAERGH